MNKKKAQKIFAQYNPTDAVIRCPRGRSQVRKLLDSYAKAAANLYGVISKKEFVEIFNSQNVVQTTTDEVFTLLLPLVLKDTWYCFYKDYIVHCWAVDDFDFADCLRYEQGDKPRYIPEKAEFLNFENPAYESEPQKTLWSKLIDFILRAWPNSERAVIFCLELHLFSVLGFSSERIGKLLNEHKIVFKDQKQAQRFFDLFSVASNDTRSWANNGHSPNELAALAKNLRQKKDRNDVEFNPKIKVGPNEPCLCGSGKKYKKCCRLVEIAGTANLSPDEIILFFETWFGLIGFVNEQKKVVDEIIEPIFPNPTDDRTVVKVRDVLWENPRLINDYLHAATLPQEKIKLLESWRDHRLKGDFLLVEYTPAFAVLMATKNRKHGKLYGVKGISHPLSTIMQRELPILIEAVLLPFKGKIIFDSFIYSKAVVFGEGAKTAFQKEYRDSLKLGIITSLEQVFCIPEFLGREDPSSLC